MAKTVRVRVEGAAEGLRKLGRRRSGFPPFLLVAAVSAGWMFPSSLETAEGKTAATGKREGLAAWDKVYSVLTHPRCINCHTATWERQFRTRRRRCRSAPAMPRQHRST